MSQLLIDHRIDPNHISILQWISLAQGLWADTVQYEVLYCMIMSCSVNQVDDSSSSTPPVQTESSRVYSCVGQSLPDSVSVTYRLFQMEHKSMVQHSLPILCFNVVSVLFITLSYMQLCRITPIVKNRSNKAK